MGSIRIARHCEERLVRRSSTSEGGSDEAIHSFFRWIDGLLREACHRAARCADPLARNDEETPSLHRLEVANLVGNFLGHGCCPWRAAAPLHVDLHPEGFPAP